MFMAETNQVYEAEANMWRLNAPFRVSGFEEFRALTIHDQLMGVAPAEPQDRAIVFDRKTEESVVLTHHLLEEPVRVLFDEDFISVLCNDSGRIIRFDRSSFDFHDHFGSVDGNTALRFAHDMRWGPEGDLHIATESQQYGRLQVWSPDGEYVGAYEELDSEWLPTALSIDKIGQLWAADYAGSQIRLFDVENKTHLKDVALDSKPLDIHIGKDNRIYVGLENGIAILDSEGMPLSKAPLDLVTKIFALGR